MTVEHELNVGDKFFSADGTQEYVVLKVEGNVAFCGKLDADGKVKRGRPSKVTFTI